MTRPDANQLAFRAVRNILDGARPLALQDAKWKVPDGGPSMADLRQMFTYNELLATPRALLLYPASASGAPLAGRFIDRHHYETLHLELFDEHGWSTAPGAPPRSPARPAPPGRPPRARRPARRRCLMRRARPRRAAAARRKRRRLVARPYLTRPTTTIIATASS